MNAALALEDVERFRHVVARRMGLSFEESKLPILGELLRNRLDATGSSCEAYLEALRADARHAEISLLAQTLTVNETYFFRNIEQFRVLSAVALPERLAARAGAKHLRFLSAGCASGEEPYSLAIAVRQAVDPSWEISIRAVDINPEMIKKAAAGRYSKWVLRETPAEIQRRWFQADKNDVVLDEAIRTAVKFEVRNLAADDPDLWEPEAYDIVFCRNVIMYFTPESAAGLVQRLTRALAPGGYLFLGHAETLRGLSQDFHLCHSHGAFYYQRKDRLDPAAQRATGLSPQAIAAPAPLRALPALSGDWVDAIGEATGRIARLADGTRQAAHEEGVRRGRDLRLCDLAAPIDLLRKERFADALHLVENLPPQSASDPDVLLLLAVLLVQSGQFGRAEHVCRGLLKADDLNAGAHYVLALCREGEGDRRGAAEHDQVAAYLDPAFAMPRLHLGRLLRREGDLKNARRELRLALTLLQREDASRLLLFGGGFSRNALITLCRGELVACGEKS
jgi:chemotaxis protein methyltransferase CheR